MKKFREYLLESLKVLSSKSDAQLAYLDKQKPRPGAGPENRPKSADFGRIFTPAAPGGHLIIS